MGDNDDDSGIGGLADCFSFSFPSSSLSLLMVERLTSANGEQRIWGDESVSNEVTNNVLLLLLLLSLSLVQSTLNDKMISPSSFRGGL